MTTDSAPAPSLASQVQELLAPVLQRKGFELVVCRWHARNHTVQLFIDHSADEAAARGLDPARCAITLDDCQAVSHLATDALSTLPALASNDDWQLEVSSPGIERPLQHAGDFARYAGLPVRFRLKRGVAVASAKGPLGAGPHDADLESADATGATFRLASGVLHIAFDDIERAHLRPTF